MVCRPSNQGSLMFLPEAPLGSPRFKFLFYTVQVGRKREMVLQTGIDRMIEILMMILILVQVFYVLSETALCSTTESKNINYREYKHRMMKVPLNVGRSSIISFIPFYSFIPVSLFPKTAKISSR